MIRGLWYFLQLAALILVAVWLAQQTGPVSIQWHGWLVETSVGMLAFIILAVAAVIVLLLRVWRSVRATPHAIGRFRFRRRRNRGYVALVRALSAIAAGEGAQALRHASEAEAIAEPALGHLAAAEAAELAGELNRAEAEYTVLRERPDTALIGLRGLIGLKERQGQLDAALLLAREARRLAPKSPWVAGHLFDLEDRAGAHAEAEKAFADAAKLGVFPSEQDDGRLARVLLARAAKAEAAGAAAEALTDAERAHKLDPKSTEAAILAARLLARSGRVPAAERILARSWAEGATEALADAWIALAPRGDATQRLRQAEKLHALDRSNVEGRLALAEAEIACGRWAEARAQLSAPDMPGDRRVCRLMSSLESAAGNQAAALSWYERSLDAAPRVPVTAPTMALPVAPAA